MSGGDAHGDGGEDESADRKEYVDAAGAKVGEVEEVTLAGDCVPGDDKEAVNVDDEQGRDRSKDLDRVESFHRERETGFKVSGVDLECLFEGRCDIRARAEYRRHVVWKERSFRPGGR